MRERDIETMTETRKLRTTCIIESPFKGKTKEEAERNRVYLERCIRWCVEKGYTPYASHKMLTDALDDNDPEERSTGIECGLDMSEQLLLTGAVVFAFIDYGYSDGMMGALERYNRMGYKHAFVEPIELGPNPKLTRIAGGKLARRVRRKRK